MRIVIDIPENEYKLIKEVYEKNDKVESIYSYIYHGTPLPEHHGDLIDRNEIIKDVAIVDSLVLGKFRVVSMIESQQTVIEGSDKE